MKKEVPCENKDSFIKGWQAGNFLPKRPLDERLGFLCILGFGGLLAFAKLALEAGCLLQL